MPDNNEHKTMNVRNMELQTKKEMKAHATMKEWTLAKLIKEMWAKYPEK